MRMTAHGDYIDGGPGDDCIVLEGAGDRIVIGGSGNDRTILVPSGTSEATIQQIFAHCGDPAYLAAIDATRAEPAKPKIAAPPTTATTAVPAHVPSARASFEIDGEVVAILCAALIAVAFLTSRMAR